MKWDTAKLASIERIMGNANLLQNLTIFSADFLVAGFVGQSVLNTSKKISQNWREESRTLPHMEYCGYFKPFKPCIVIYHFSNFI